jgi:DHA2 family multidrug resistance protein
LLVFVGSTVACGMATSVSMLIVFRVIQGAAGGLVMPVTMLLMLDLYPAEKRGLGTSIWSMGASCGSLTGIPLGVCSGASELAGGLLLDSQPVGGRWLPAL